MKVSALSLHERRRLQRGNVMKKEYDLASAKRGAVALRKGKTRITIYLDTDLIEEFRERADQAGYGYQTMINQALREHLQKVGGSLDEDAVRR